MTRPLKNIWVAAGDGDLDRVTQLIQHDALDPNTPDPNTYTPMHAAASYGHIPILEYLIAHGGDVNVTDSDGDTPLYTVEDLATARFLVEHGALVARQNNEGVSPIEHLSEDFPQIAEYLRGTLDPATAAAMDTPAPGTAGTVSQHAQEVASEELTSALMADVHDIMARAEAEGRDPEEELRRAVSQHVFEGVATGFGMAAEEDAPRRGGDDNSETPVKRSRVDGEP